MDPNFLTALLISGLAGLSTAIGGFLSLNKKLSNRSFLAFSLGFAAGAMLLLSFTEIFPKSLSALMTSFDDKTSYLIAFAAFFFGMFVVLLIDKLIPKDLNPNETEGSLSKSKVNRKKLLRTGILISIAITLHNFPEGFATFMASLNDPSLGIALAVAIAIHNIPEGIAIAIPIFAATGSKSKTILLTALSGLAEPLGALIGFLLLSTIMCDSVFGIVFGTVGGIMVFIAIDELLPAARRYETNQHQTVYGLMLGMFVVAISIVLFK